MSAQEIWKRKYNDFFEMATESQKNLARNDMYDARREAALERKLEAAQRTIEAQAQRIAELESESSEAWPNPWILSHEESERLARQMRSR